MVIWGQMTLQFKCSSWTNWTYNRYLPSVSECVDIWWRWSSKVRTWWGQCCRWRCVSWSPANCPDSSSIMATAPGSTARGGREVGSSYQTICHTHCSFIIIRVNMIMVWCRIRRRLQRYWWPGPGRSTAPASWQHKHHGLCQPLHQVQHLQTTRTIIGIWSLW